MTEGVPNIEGIFRKSLNAHGFGFQYSVLRRIDDLQRDHRAAWLADVSEFPVENSAGGTRIDFVLRHRTGRVQLVCECKRANPAFANWFFATTPFLARKEAAHTCNAERLRHFHGEIRAEGTSVDVIPDGYQVAIEVKSQEKGDSAPTTGRSAIEDAVSQVLRGLNGLVQFYARMPSLLDSSKPTFLFPVVFTTAAIWTTSAKLDNADLVTGKIEPPPI